MSHLQVLVFSLHGPVVTSLSDLRSGNTGYVTRGPPAGREGPSWLLRDVDPDVSVTTLMSRKTGSTTETVVILEVVSVSSPFQNFFISVSNIFRGRESGRCYEEGSGTSSPLTLISEIDDCLEKDDPHLPSTDV